jgi:hypothetical protein
MTRSIATRGALAAALAAIAIPAAHASCGTAFCTVNTDWNAQDAWTEPGTRYGLRFEYLDQDQPQTGTRKLAVGQIHKHHDEVRTINRNWLASVDHAFDSTWGVSLALPLIDRSHRHIHNHMGAQLHDSWNFTEAGDLRALARYQFSPAQSNDGSGASSGAGVELGLKLPTGAINVHNAEGDLAERTLQPGTGTTDALLGAHYRRRLPQRDLSWFAHAQAQLPLNKRDEFRPGQRLSVDLGLRYDASSKLGLMLQTNVLLRGRDKGAEAETADSGGRSLWLSPGMSYAIGTDAQVYAFLQRALYQHVNGVQLVATQAVALGVSARF